VYKLVTKWRIHSMQPLQCASTVQGLDHQIVLWGQLFMYSQNDTTVQGMPGLPLQCHLWVVWPQQT
jgi:hypothetical protein